MKTTMPFFQLARWFAPAVGLLLLGNFLGAAELAPRLSFDAGTPLHVYVDVPGAIRPGAFSPWSEEDFSRVLGGYVRTELKKADYPGEVVVHQRWAELPKEGQRLEINVIRWNANRAHGLECTLTAELTAADGRTDRSGVVSATQLEWSHNIHGTAGALEDVARRSMRTLYKRFAVPEAKK